MEVLVTTKIILFIAVLLPLIILLIAIVYIVIEFNNNNTVVKDSIANSTLILNYKFKRCKSTKSIKYKDIQINKVEGGLSLLFPYVITNIGYVKRNSRLKKHIDLIFKYGEI